MVVDPQLLVEAHEHDNGDAAKLLALLVYGRTCATAYGLRIREVDEIEATHGEKGLDATELAALRSWAERARDVAIARKARLEEVFEQYTPDDLQLVVSTPLLEELVELARASQGSVYWHVKPDVVRRHTLRWTMKRVPKLGPAPRYLGPDRLYRREYLIHTAVVGEADSLITGDSLLLLPGDAMHSDPTSRHEVRAYTLRDFIDDRLSANNFRFSDIDAPAILRAAAADYGPE